MTYSPTTLCQRTPTRPAKSALSPLFDMQYLLRHLASQREPDVAYLKGKGKAGHHNHAGIHLDQH
eukprot:2351833-Prorocentrum_lima.AAC.1